MEENLQSFKSLQIVQIMLMLKWKGLLSSGTYRVKSWHYWLPVRATMQEVSAQWIRGEGGCCSVNASSESKCASQVQASSDIWESTKLQNTPDLPQRHKTMGNHSPLFLDLLPVGLLTRWWRSPFRATVLVAVTLHYCSQSQSVK